MDDVEAHVARAGDAADGIQVRSVVVHEGARGVEDVPDRLDVLVEEPERRRVRQHQSRRVLVHLAAEVVQVDVPARVGLHRRHLVAGHGHARRVRPVRGVGNDDLAAHVVLPPLLEVRAHQEQARELALAARRRLEADRVEPRHLAQDLLQLPFELERALHGFVVGERVQVAEAGQRRDALVHARVVLHRARAQRVEARVDPEVARRERREVAQHLRLGELRQARRRRAGELGRDGRNRQLRARHREPAASRAGLLVDQLHDRPRVARGCGSRRAR